jgi:hypothetical protein
VKIMTAGVVSGGVDGGTAADAENRVGWKGVSVRLAA